MKNHIILVSFLLGLWGFSACVKEDKVDTYDISEANMRLLGRPPQQIKLKRFPGSSDSMFFHLKEERKNYRESSVKRFMGKRKVLIEERSYHYINNRTLQELEYGLYPVLGVEDGEPKFVLRFNIRGFPAGRLSCLVYKGIAYDDEREFITDVVSETPATFNYFWDNKILTGMYEISMNPSRISTNTVYSQVVFKPGEGLFGLKVYDNHFFKVE